MMDIDYVIDLLSKLPKDSKFDLTIEPEWELDTPAGGGIATSRIARRYIELRVVQELPP